ncbi:hypothetical protein GOARA_033_00140 [Gordonia araii NBRC 100433]|uniref:DUF3558 domain-containing protein n=2 Tax=Gordonia araii TaxID=263909 RepID=G7H038_9ACTN|nr:hypothetical protein [Gordonia araii]GAB09213.1 hypothetical protein GOARA_033_00140 [Gordonia araii NBRC 100433]
MNAGNMRAIRTVLLVVVVCVLSAACGLPGQWGRPDLKVTSGTAQVPLSENPLSMDQIWDPSDVDETGLIDLFQMGGDARCSVLPSGDVKACHWPKERGSFVVDIGVHTFSTKVSFNEVRLRENFTDFRPTTVGGAPALFYHVKGQRPEVCNMAWGNPTGSTWISVQYMRAGDEDLLDMCGWTQAWAAFVWPSTRQEHPKPESSATSKDVWQPDSLDEPGFLRPNKLRRIDWDTEIQTCQGFPGAIRSCTWEVDPATYGLHNPYVVRVSSVAQPFTEFKSRRVEAYPSTKAVTVADQSAIRYKALPGTCSIAWPTPTGTAWLRVSLESNVRDTDIDSCTEASRIAASAIPATN